MTKQTSPEAEPEDNWGTTPPWAAEWQHQLAASTTPPERSPALPLSARERTIAMLFADDHTADDIALVLGLSAETVRSYLVRARLKYKTADRPALNKLQLRARLVEDGYLEE